MNLKQKVQFALVAVIDKKISDLNTILNETIESTSSDSKSSAGDKHETSVAMAQIEQEKLSKQLNELLSQKSLISSINPDTQHSKITRGSLVETNHGCYYVSIGLGALEMNNKSIFTLNPLAPLGQLMLGKSKGESFSLNNRKFEIISVI